MTDDFSVLLRSGYKFTFSDGKITEWKDARPQPTADDIPALAAQLRKTLTDQEAAVAHRRYRAAAYIAELGEEGGFETMAGDVLDALIKWTDGDRADLEAMKVKIAAIKARFPKAPPAA